jgi:4-hydroxy-tetrahydrodipicolinate reductase
MGAVRFQLIGKVDGVPRVVVEHVTRTRADEHDDWPRPSKGGGCYKVIVTGEPMMELELSHHGEHGDHNVSGMIVTAQRLVNSVRAVVEAPGGLVTALDLPLVTGKGLVAS